MLWLGWLDRFGCFTWGGRIALGAFDLVFGAFGWFDWPDVGARADEEEEVETRNET